MDYQSLTKEQKKKLFKLFLKSGGRSLVIYFVLAVLLFSASIGEFFINKKFVDSDDFLVATFILNLVMYVVLLTSFMTKERGRILEESEKILKDNKEN